MTRQIWSAIACAIVLVLALAGFAGVTDYYDTHDATYAFVGHFVPKGEYAKAEAYARAVQQDDVPTLQAMSDPSLLNDNFFPNVPKIGAYFPAGLPRSTGALNYTTSASVAPGQSRHISTLVINHVYPDGTACLTTTTFNEANGKVLGFYVRRLTPADLKILRFNPLAANPAQAVILVLALVIIAFTTFTLYRCLATPKLRWKWLWFLFITAGIGSIRFVWPTLAMQITPIDVHWGAAGVYQMIFQPAIVYLNIPVGAAAFWLSGQWRTAKVAN